MGLSQMNIRGRNGSKVTGRTNKRRLVVALVTVLIPVAVPVIVGTSELASAATSNWYAVDLHAHSVVSADAIPDVGIIKRNAKQAGLSAVFLSDHNQGSDFSISTHTANHSFFANDLTRWTTVGANVGLVTAPVHTAGGSSIHVKDNGSKEGYLYTKRGGNFMPGTGSMTTKFSVYPVSLSGSASLYVSASIGGDNTISTPAGYTLAATGEPTVCKSVVLVWYLGAAPPTTGYNPTSSKCGAVKPAAVVKQFPISPSQCDQPVAVNTWITCTVDVTAAVNTIAATDKPYDYNAISYLKMAATGGADAYFDDYATDKGPLPGTILSRAGAEFAARNALLPQFTDPGTFAMYPSLEEGTNSHANRFNFNIQTAGEFVTGCSPSASCSYSAGIDGLLPTEISGYPAQLNHPGVPGGVTDAQAISTCPTGTNPACGADLMEVRERNMLRDWDSVLGTGEPLIGDWTTDDHSGSWNSLSPVTVIYAPSLSSDDLLHALFEGRAYNRQLGSGASRLRVVLNLDPLSVEPYPARYPVYVPTSQPTASMHVDISGIPTGDVVRWIANGVVVATDSPSAGSVVTTRSIPLAAASTAVRVEVGPSSDTTLAANPHGASEAIIFRRGPNGLPATTSVHVDRVTPGSAPASTRYWTKGVTAATWTAAGEVLGLTLTDRPGSLAEVHVASATAPRTVTIGGATVTAAGSLGEFESARGPSWVVDAGTIRLKVPAVTGTDSAVISFGAGSGDLSPPTTPGTPLTTSVDSTSVALGWARSSDNVGVVAYDVRRNGVVVGSVAQPVSGDPSFTDLNLSPGTSYTYAVTARDAAGNQTTSSPLSVTTPADGTQRDAVLATVH
jgi:hypothetical protein